jgi:phosphocarrier protein FPr
MYDAFALTLDDPALRERASGMVFGERLRAETAWARAAAWIAEKYEGAGSEPLRLRSADLADVRDRVLEALAGRERTPLAPAPDVTEPSILVARDVSAADVALLDTDRVIGVCTAEGGAQSHAAILARGVGLPMVAGLGPGLLRAGTGTVIAMDGSTGEVTWVSEGTGKKRARGAAARAGESGFERPGGTGSAVSEVTRPAPALTRDGRMIEVCANASSLAEVRAAVRRGADGVGVLRTEFLFAGRRSPPTEEEQLRLYESMADALGGRPLTVRTLDAGGDKPIRFLSMAKEDNPFLGVRGIRLSLRNPGVFLEQLRAVLRASARGAVKILLPMVSRVEEVGRARELLERAKSELAGRGQPFDGEIELGMMIEVPSAALTADRLAREVSFFSVGTNDLVQYTLAADRANPNVSALGDALHPAVLRLIERCVSAGRGAGIRVSVCGEMARDRVAVPILVGLGVDGLSVSPVDIPEVKTIVGRISAKDAEALAARALVAESAETARAEAGRFLDAGPAGER